MEREMGATVSQEAVKHSQNLDSESGRSEDVWELQEISLERDNHSNNI